MSSVNQNTKEPPAWENLVDDYLELSASLRVPERTFLIRHLRNLRVSAEKIHPHISFSIGGKMVVICKGKSPGECLVYHPRRYKIGAHKLKTGNGQKPLPAAQEVCLGKAPVCK